MTRRIDQITADKVALALLSRDAFGLDVGMRTAMFFGLPRFLVMAIFSRATGVTRKDAQGIRSKTDRRQQQRQSAHSKSEMPPA